MFDKIVNDNNIFKDKMVNSTIHIAKQIINRNKKYRVGQRSIITSALFDKTLKKQGTNYRQPNNNPA